MSKRFESKNVLITGGTSGIGLATAKRVIAEGGRALVTGLTAGRIEEANEVDGISAISNDASAPDAVGSLAEAVDSELAGRIDGLFLNAGLGAFQTVSDIDSDEFDRQFAINVRGPILQLGALAGSISDGGSVLITTSVVNDMGMPGSGVYAGTKGAIRSSVGAFSGELAGRGIRVNSISPGPINTNFFSRTGMGEEEISQFAEQVLAQVPLGRFGTSEEVAAAATFLLSDDASYVTGTELVVDGGMS